MDVRNAGIRYTESSNKEVGSTALHKVNPIYFEERKAGSELRMHP